MDSRNHSEVPMVRRPVIGRPVLGLRRIGVPMYWDPDPPQGGDHTPPAPPAPPAPAAPPAAPPSSAGDGEAAKLRRENERLTKALQGLQESEAKAKAAAEEKEREDAAKRGEWEKLYGEEKAKGKTLTEQLEQERKVRGELEEFLRGRTKTALESAPEDLRKPWKAALEAQPNAIAAQTTLDALMATLGTEQSGQSPKPGAAGRSKTTIDLRELSRNTPANRAQLNELVLRELKAKGG